MAPEQAREIVAQHIISYCLATFVEEESDGDLYPRIGKADWAKIHAAVAEFAHDPRERDVHEALDVLETDED